MEKYHFRKNVRRGLKRHRAHEKMSLLKEKLRHEEGGWVKHKTGPQQDNSLVGHVLGAGAPLGRSVSSPDVVSREPDPRGGD